MKKVLGICGSPRKGNAEWALQNVLSECASQGAHTETILLREARIEMCDGCLSCEDVKMCPVQDDMQTFYGKLAEADVIIFATPAYFDNVTGRLKNFIDRTNLIVDTLAGKTVGIIVVGQADETSWKRVADYLRAYCDIVKMKVVAEFYRHARDNNDLLNDKDAERQCQELARRVLSSMK